MDQNDVSVRLQNRKYKDILGDPEKIMRRLDDRYDCGLIAKFIGEHFYKK
jgi:hypothetical protein